MSYRILVVDDDTDIAQAVELNLQLDGFTVEVVTDSLSALAAAMRSVPDCVVLDVVMPRRDGIQICQDFRSDERTKEVPLLMLSARSLSKDIQAAIEAGADDYLVKPFEPEELVRRVQALIARRTASASEG